MIVVCDGMPRSGSTWSFNVVKALLQVAAPRRCIRAGYADDIGRFLDDVPQSVEHVVVKCHQLDNAAHQLLARAKFVYTIRSLYETVPSCMRTFNLEFEEALSAIESSLELYELHRNATNALIVDYSDVTQHPAVVTDAIASYLGLQLNPQQLAEVNSRTSAGCLRRVAARLEAAGATAYDAETLVHPNHFSDRDVPTLTPEQVAIIARLSAEHGLAALR